MSALPLMTADDLRRLPAPADLPDDDARPECCAMLRARGWEALPAAFDASGLQPVGTLRATPDGVEPVLDEYHPAGTRYWSAEAPVALHHYPYNMSDVWQCRSCGRPFLRYAENGGYYTEQRIRELDISRVVDAPLD